MHEQLASTDVVIANKTTTTTSRIIFQTGMVVAERSPLLCVR
jgi:hypothetical protein